MKSKFILSLIFIFALSLSQNNMYAQSFHYGYMYQVGSDDYIKIKYTKTYSGSGDLFVTTYKLYHPTKGYNNINVIATHSLPEKKVVVEVKSATGGLFSEIRKEEISYETPSSEPFGRRGIIGAFSGNRVPNQLAVQFVSKKYENVNVIDIFGSTGIESINQQIFYTLDNVK